jgi:hypothetical protein
MGFGDGLTVLGTAPSAPEAPEHSPDGSVWIRCHREECGCWTHYQTESGNTKAG